MDNIGEKLKHLRKSKGLSQSQVAEAAGLTQASYASIESGKTKSISIQVGKGLAQILGRDFGSLFEIEINDNASLIKELKEEKIRLEQDLDNYRTLIQMLKNKNMIRSPKEKRTEENIYKHAGDAELIKWLEESEEKENKIIEEITSNPLIRNLLEDGSLSDGMYYQIWKEHFNK